MKLKLAAGALACTLGLGGCGGSDERINTAEGLWQGTTNTGNTATMVVLDDGQTFGISRANDVIINGLYGSVVGTGTTVNGGSGRDFNFAAQTISPITYGGSVSAQSTLALSTTSNFNFSGAYSSSFDQIPVITQIAGSYSGVGILGVSNATQPITMTIGIDNTIAFSIPDCVASGSVTPRGGDKNVFNVRIGFSGTGCTVGNGVTTIGVAIRDQNVSPARVYVMSVINDASNGFYWTGT